ISGWISSILSATTRKNSASLRSCSSLSATYFARSLGRPRRLTSTRSAWAFIENTCAGKKPRNPSVSRSCSVKAVPLLRSGSRNSAKPRGESKGCGRGFARTDTLMKFPPKPVYCLAPQRPPFEAEKVDRDQPQEKPSPASQRIHGVIGLLPILTPFGPDVKPDLSPPGVQKRTSS